MTSDRLRGCFNCERCATEADHAPFALVSESRYGRLTVANLKEHYGVCDVVRMLVPVDSVDIDTPCCLDDWERRGGGAE